MPVGSRTGAVFRRSGLACCSPFPLGVPQYPNRESVSSPRHIAPSVQISRTGRTCWLRAKSYEAYRAGATFAPVHRRSWYSLNKPSRAYSHSLLHRFQPKPLRPRARIRCCRTFFSTQRLTMEKQELE